MASSTPTNRSIWISRAARSRVSGPPARRNYRASVDDTVGFSTHDGEYTAVPAKGGQLGVHKLELPVEGSFESVAHATGLPILLVDLRRASKSEPASSWLAEPVLFGGGIGALQVDKRFKPMNLHEGFDAIIHIDHTTASRQLPGPGKN